MDDTPIPTSRVELGRSLHDLSVEHGFLECEIEGRIPEELSGTLYRNGPGLFSLFGHDYLNWLDGDGVISAFRFDRGRASAAARVTLTPELIEERAKKEAIYTSGSTVGPHWWRRVGGQQKNPTNIHVLAWHDRVFATTDAGMPIEIDPWTLETVGPWKLSGAAKGMVGAHSRRCPRTGSAYILGVAMGMTGMELDVYELPRAGEPRFVTGIATHGFPFVHDFAITESHLVVAVPPLEVGVAGFLAGVSAPTKNMRWAPERGTEILLIERAAPHAVKRITTTRSSPSTSRTASRRATARPSRTSACSIGSIRARPSRSIARGAVARGSRPRSPTSSASRSIALAPCDARACRTR